MISLLSSIAQVALPVQVFPGNENISIKLKILPNTSNLKQFSQNRTSLVDRISENIEWEEFKTSGIACGDSNRCFHQGLGSIQESDVPTKVIKEKDELFADFMHSAFNECIKRFFFNKKIFYKKMSLKKIKRLKD